MTTTTFQYSAELEAVARLREERPEAFERVSPKVRMQLAYYENSKREAEAAGLDTSPKAAA